MASGYSQPGSTYRHLNPVDTFDENLVATVLGAKQQRYDANLAKIDAALAQYGNVDLARAEDKEYLSERLNALTSEINNAGIQDLSSSSVTRNIEQHIDQAIDGKVIKQIGNTQKLRKFQTEVEEIKNDDRGLYAEQNEAYALHQAGFEGYITGQSDNLGNLEYSAYVDVAQKQRDILDETFSIDKGITRKVPTGDGYFVESTHYGLTPTEVRSKVESNLTPQELKQLEIDGWAKYGKGAAQAYENYLKPAVKGLEDEKAELKLNYAGLSIGEKASVDEKVGKIDATIKNLTARKGSEAQLYKFLGTEELINGLSASYAPLETSIKYSNDSSYYKDLESASKQASEAVGGLDRDGNGIADVSTRSQLTAPDENWRPTQKAEEELTNYQTNIKTIFNSAYNRMSSEQQETFNRGYKNYLQQQGLDDTAANKSLYMLEKSNGGKGDLYNVQEYSEAMSLEREYRQKKQTQVDNYNEALKEQEAINTSKVINEAFEDNPDIKILDENGRPTTIGNYINSAGGVGRLTPEQTKTVMASVYADFALSKTKDYTNDFVGRKNKESYHKDNVYNVSRLASVFGEVGKEPMLVNPSQVVYSEYTDGKYQSNFEGLKREMQLPSKLTKEQFEEHIRPHLKKQSNGFLDDIPFLGAAINKIEQSVEPVMRNAMTVLGMNAVSKVLVIGGENTKTRAQLEAALKNGIYDKQSLGDDSFEDDQYVNSVLSDRNDFVDKYEKKMAADAGKFAQNQEIIVEPSGTRKGAEVPEFEDLQRFAAFEKDKAIYVRRSGVEGMYEAYQVEGNTTIKNGESVDKSTTQSVLIAERDLVGFPFYETLNKQSGKRRITTATDKELISNSTGFVDERDQRSYVVNTAKMLGFGDQQMSLLTTQGAKNSLVKGHPTLMASPSGAGYKKLVSDMVDNGHLFRLNVHANDRDRYDVAIQFQATDDRGQRTWKNLKVMPTNTTDITETVKTIDVAPQLFYYQYMDKLLTDIEKNGDSFVAEDVKLLKKILYPQQ